MIKISDLKVLGVKVKQSVYDEFRSLPGDVSTNLRCAVEDYIKHAKETRLTTVNHVEKQKKYEDLISHLETHEEDIQRLISDSKEINDFDKFVLLIFENIALLFRLFQVVFDDIDSLYEELEPIEKIKAEKRQKETHLIGRGTQNKDINGGGKFATTNDSVPSDTTRFEQGKELEQTEKPKEQQKPTKKEILQEKGKTRDKVAEKQKGSVWEGA